MYRSDEFFCEGLAAPGRRLTEYVVIAETRPDQLFIICGGLAYRLPRLNEEDIWYLRRQPAWRLSWGVPATAIQMGSFPTVRIREASGSMPALPELASIERTVWNRYVHLDFGTTTRVVIPCRPGEKVFLKLRHG